MERKSTQEILYPSIFFLSDRYKLYIFFTKAIISGPIIINLWLLKNKPKFIFCLPISLMRDKNTWSHDQGYECDMIIHDI